MAKNDRTGGYWRGDKWIQITWGDKISKGLMKQPTKVMQCVGCGANFEAVLSRGPKWCSQACRHKVKYTDVRGIEKKAIVIGANILMGRGKREFLMSLISNALGTSCLYCDTKITLENMGLDHKDAYKTSAARNNKKPGTKEFRRHMDRQENLQIICKGCNQIKGSMDAVQFERLLDFLKTDEDMRKTVLTRLKRSVAPFARNQRARK